MKLSKHMRRMSRIGGVWLDHDCGKSIKRIAYEQCITEEEVQYILDNYEQLQDQICGWD